MVWYKPSGKSEKARDRLNAIQDEANNLKSILESIAGFLPDVVEKAGMKLEIASKQQNGKPQKLRGMISWLPKRVEFTYNDLKFYIDFVLLGSDGDDIADLRGYASRNVYSPKEENVNYVKG